MYQSTGQGLVAYTWTILAIAVMVPPNLCKNQDIAFTDSKETARIEVHSFYN